MCVKSVIDSERICSNTSEEKQILKDQTLYSIDVQCYIISFLDMQTIIDGLIYVNVTFNNHIMKNKKFVPTLKKCIFSDYGKIMNHKFFSKIIHTHFGKKKQENFRKLMKYYYNDLHRFYIKCCSKKSLEYRIFDLSNTDCSLKFFLCFKFVEKSELTFI